MTTNTAASLIRIRQSMAACYLSPAETVLLAFRLDSGQLHFSDRLAIQTCNGLELVDALL